MGTCYWIGVRTGEDAYDAVAVWKASYLAAPFWDGEAFPSRWAYIRAVLSSIDEDHRADPVWARAAAHWVWNKLELDKVTQRSAGVRSFSDHNDDWMMRDGAMHRGGYWEPGTALVRVIGDSAEVVSVR